MKRTPLKQNDFLLPKVWGIRQGKQLRLYLICFTYIYACTQYIYIYTYIYSSSNNMDNLYYFLPNQMTSKSILCVFLVCQALLLFYIGLFSRMQFKLESTVHFDLQANNWFLLPDLPLKMSFCSDCSSRHADQDSILKLQ